MGQIIKKTTGLVIVCTMVFNMVAAPSFAWGWLNNAVNDVSDWTDNAIDDVGDWTDNAVDDVGDWTTNAVDDVDNWTTNAIDDVGDWTDNAIDDVSDWTDNAIDDVGDWTTNALKDTSHWLNHASGDVKKWVKTASKDTIHWLETAVGDVGVFLDGMVSGVKSYRSPDKPNINGMYQSIELVMSYEDINKSYVNLFNDHNGQFSDLVNIKEQQLPAVTENRIKDVLKSAGLSTYWSEFAVKKLSNASEGASVGNMIESVIPFDFVLNGRIANKIDEIVNEEGFEWIDKTHSIEPSNDIAGLSFKFSTEESMSLSGPSTVMFKGITTIGYRDTVNVTFIAGGQEYTGQPFVENNTLGFYATVADASNLTCVVTNNFDAPANIPLEIAKGFQDTVNGLAPFGKPISDKATEDIAGWLGNTELLYEQSKTDKKTGDKSKELKKMPSLNDFYASGDVGGIVSNLIYNVPVAGDVVSLIFKSTGNDETFENIIRDIVNQKEVKSYLQIKNPQLLVEKSLINF